MHWLRWLLLSVVLGTAVVALVGVGEVLRLEAEGRWLLLGIGGACLCLGRALLQRSPEPDYREDFHA